MKNESRASLSVGFCEDYEVDLDNKKAKPIYVLISISFFIYISVWLLIARVRGFPPF